MWRYDTNSIVYIYIIFTVMNHEYCKFSCVFYGPLTFSLDHQTFLCFLFIFIFHDLSFSAYPEWDVREQSNLHQLTMTRKNLVSHDVHTWRKVKLFQPLQHRVLQHDETISPARLWGTAIEGFACWAMWGPRLWACHRNGPMEVCKMWSGKNRDSA